MNKIFQLSAFFLSFNLAFAQSDEPCSATVLTVLSGSCSSSYGRCINPPVFTNSTNTSAGVTLPPLSCYGFNNTTRDFWYKAIVPASGRLNIKVKDDLPKPSASWNMALYTSSNPETCAGSTFTTIATQCTISFPDYTVAQPPGTVIYIRMWRSATSDQTENKCYAICANDLDGSFPNCAALLTPANNATNVSAHYTNLSWSSASSATRYDLYHSTTYPPYILQGNISATSFNISALAYNTTYYWYVIPKNSDNVATWCDSTIFSYTTGGAAAAPANDECINAIPIAVSSQTINGTTISATQSRPAEVCNNFSGDANDDVWYKFTTLQAGSASFVLTPSSNFDAVMDGYSGTCGSLTNIGCANASFIPGGGETLTLSNLAANTTYYFRVYAFGSAGSEGNFSLRALGAALPVQLEDLKGTRQDSSNLLTWTTYTEINNKGFELQRSADGTNFSSLIFIPSKAVNGNSTSTLAYFFQDVKPFSGKSFYRLKQIDKDGKIVFSNIVLLKGTKATKFEIIALYPNPTQGKLNIVIYSPSICNVKVLVTDITGKVLLKQPAQLLGMDNKITVDINALPRGNYVVKAVADNNSESAFLKFVKQ